MYLNKTLSLAFLLLASGLASADPVSSIQIDDVLLSPELQALVRSDLHALVRLKIDAKPGSAFGKVFQGTQPSDLVRYLNERIHYIGIDDPSDNESGTDNSTYASNFGPSWLSYYYHHVVLKEKDAVPAEAKFRNTSIPLTSPRTGFMAVGGAYNTPGTSDIDRMDTLIHEARHSDCTRVPGLADLVSHDKDLHGQISEAGQACNHVHPPCPQGHALAGELACDGHHWGAYAVGYVFSKAVFDSCRNCSEEQRQAALATATEDFSRLSKPVQQGVLNGTSPEPEMGSLE